MSPYHYTVAVKYLSYSVATKEDLQGPWEKVQEVYEG